MRTSVQVVGIAALIALTLSACSPSPAASEVPSLTLPAPSSDGASATPGPDATTLPSNQPAQTEVPTITTGPPVDPEAVESARRVIEAADLSDPATIDEIGATLRFTAEGEWASRELLIADASIDVLWAALWVYASAGSDPAPLHPLLTNDNASIRVIAGATLIALGDAAGFEVLVAALPDDQQLLGSEPPIPIQLFAVQTLATYVAAEGAPAEPDTEEDVAAAATAWSAWLDENVGQLLYDATQGRWGI